MRTESICLDDITINVRFKPVRNLRLSVQPPEGHVTLVVPLSTSLVTAQAFAQSKVAWIRAKQDLCRSRVYEPAHQFTTDEYHYLWGEAYLLKVNEREDKPAGVSWAAEGITLSVRPGASQAQRAKVFYTWQKSLLHEVVPPLIAEWELTLGVKVRRYFLQRMKTRWGSCNPRAGHIRLNTELVKRPQDLLEYVMVHEMAHLIEANHGPRFFALLDKHYPCWREAQVRLRE